MRNPACHSAVTLPTPPAPFPGPVGQPPPPRRTADRSHGRPAAAVIRAAEADIAPGCGAIRCHAVRLLRLDELLDEIKDGTVAAPSPQDEPVKAVAPAPKRPIAKSDVEALYKQHVEETREAKGRKPTRAEDRKWRKDNDVRRPRLRELRAADRYPAQADGGTSRQK